MGCKLVSCEDGSRWWVCARGRDQRVHRPPCPCGKRATRLCDWPVASGVTCDASLCARCATRVGGDVDLCARHAGRGEVR